MNRSRTSSEKGSLPGRLLVLSGPSGAGKGTIIKRLLDSLDAHLSVSCTTRKPRPGEEDGKDYFFLTPGEFAHREKEGDFLETAEVFGNHYGTPKSAVLRELAEGKDVLLEIDVQGALQVKKNYDDAILIFVAPPSLGVLKSRLSGRGTETPEEVERRFARAQKEMEQACRYDCRVVNDTVDDAVAEIVTFLEGMN